MHHPRGWQTDLSHQRKARSYEIETHWYQRWADACNQACRVPRCYGLSAFEGERFILLEDLDGSGFPKRVEEPTIDEVKACLNWLARFHSKFLKCSPGKLWARGTYWHLETRPDEWRAMPEGPLKQHADWVDGELAACPWQTLVHGDAKLENFCFSVDSSSVAAVDFQYVGGGCGVQDVAYLFSSCFSESDCETHAQVLLDYYFMQLTDCLRKILSESDITQLIAQWRALYPVAWADFYRFLQGWSPGHWKMHGYSERMMREALRRRVPE